MKSIASSLPAGFTWLSLATRPSRREVEAYARLIAAKEGASPDQADAFLHEAELQLWIWRNETRRPPARRRRVGVSVLPTLMPN
jgi:hypothetical protein